MSDFQIYSIDTAPADSKPLLEAGKNAFGFVPNLYGVLAESPQLLEAYQTIAKLFSETSLSAEERHVVWLTINVEHRCHYCVPPHSAMAKNDGVDEAIVTALREERALPDARLEALRQFTLNLVRNRGWVSEEDVSTFLAAGFTKRNVQDVILGLAHKVISNYTNHLADTPIDAPFRDEKWEPVTK